MDDAELPTQCPNEDCGDIVPFNPSSQTLKLLREYTMLMKTKGLFVKETLHAELLLCVELSAECKKGAHKALAESNDWPLTIDFKSLPDRIIDLKSDIDSVIKNGIAKDDPI